MKNTLKTISLSIHCPIDYDYTESLVYKILQEHYTIRISDTASMHLYFNHNIYKALDDCYKETINIHITDTTAPHFVNDYIPDLNLFDYAIGYENIVFYRYCNLNQQEQNLIYFLSKIIQSTSILPNKSGMRYMYYDIQENIWKNHILLEKYRLKSVSIKLSLLLCIIKILLLVKIKILSFKK